MSGLLKSRNYVIKCLGFVLLIGFISLGTVGGCNTTTSGDPDSIGSGPSFQSPRGIAVEANGSLVVVDSGLEAVLRVDPISGDRVIISDATIGSGPPFISPRGIAVGSLVVVDSGLEACGTGG